MTHRTALSLTALLFTLTLSGLAKKIPLTAAALVPSATGELDVGKDKNGNTKIELKVKHLAQPGRLTPPKAGYVVWIQGSGAEATNEGQLTVNNDLNANLTTVTPLRNFAVFVTAEDDPRGAKAPAGPEVLRATVQR